MAVENEGHTNLNNKDLINKVLNRGVVLSRGILQCIHISSADYDLRRPLANLVGFGRNA